MDGGEPGAAELGTGHDRHRRRCSGKGREGLELAAGMLCRASRGRVEPTCQRRTFSTSSSATANR